jgi:hypothetical protein
MLDNEIDKTMGRIEEKRASCSPDQDGWVLIYTARPYLLEVGNRAGLGSRAGLDYAAVSTFGNSFPRSHYRGYQLMSS